jgi:hypothetical protein
MRPIGDHFYTTSEVERDSAILNHGYVSEGVACFVPEPARIGDRRNLYRLYNSSNGDHLYTTSEEERDRAVSRDGYHFERIECQIFASRSSGSDIIELFRLYKPANGNHFYTTSASERDRATTLGYIVEESDYFVLPVNSGFGTLPLLRLYNPSSDHHFYTTDPKEAVAAIANFGFVSEAEACSVPLPEVTRTQELHRLYNPETGDHFYTEDLTEKSAAILKFGYVDEGVACHVLRGEAGANTTALFRLVNETNNDHFYTISVTEMNSAMDAGYIRERDSGFVFSGPGEGKPLFRLVKKYGARVRLRTVIVQYYVNEGVAGFVFPSGTENSQPLRRAYNPANGDHFYTTSEAEVNTAAGYSDEGTACHVPNDAIPNTSEFHRLVHPDGDHFYTASDAEVTQALSVGYVYERVECRIFTHRLRGALPFFECITRKREITSTQSTVLNVFGLSATLNGRFLCNGGWTQRSWSMMRSV